MILLSVLVLAAASPVVSGNRDDAERRRAFQLYKDGKNTEALPVFEKLAAATPDDVDVIETLGLLVVGQATFLKDAPARKEARRRGRELLARAQKLGADNPLLNHLLAGLPLDGGADSEFSTKKEVEDAMREGEASFTKGDLPHAIEAYQRALMFDPTLYEAALFMGDVYFKSAEQKKAGEWFARAIAINPDRETAYRYWGDSLMKQGRVTEAGDKFVEAYIAEPYNRLARAGFANWGERLNVKLGHPRVDIPTSVTPMQNGKMTINLDPSTLKGNDKSGSGAGWMMYGLIRASWAQGEFAKQYPNEKQYRHSLKEEAAALRAVLSAVSNQKIDSEKMEPSIKVIAKLDKEGFLEAFILLALPDEGIARDFKDYRKSDVDKLRRYVVQYVLSGAATSN